MFNTNQAWQRLMSTPRVCGRSWGDAHEHYCELAVAHDGEHACTDCAYGSAH